MHMLEWLVQFLTVLSCGLFAGAAMYLFARSRLGLPNTTGVGFLGAASWWQLFLLRTTELAATEFRPSYRRAAVMQASLAALWPCGRSTRSCWIRRLTEVRLTQGSSYGGDDYMRCVAY